MVAAGLMIRNVLITDFGPIALPGPVVNALALVSRNDGQPDRRTALGRRVLAVMDKMHARARRRFLKGHPL
jgi:hypothetical protein